MEWETQTLVLSGRGLARVQGTPENGGPRYEDCVPLHTSTYVLDRRSHWRDHTPRPVMR